MGQRVISGNVVEAPKISTGKTPVLKIRVAENFSKKDSDGNYVDLPALFHNVTVFGGLAENVGNSDVRKGDRIVVVGYDRTGTYTNKENETVDTLEIIAKEVAVSMKYAQVTEQIRDRDAKAREAAEDPENA